MSKLKNPQEKKRASLAKDRRNDYGENAKASRKNIPRSKARAKRAHRRGVHQALRGAATADELDVSASEKRIADARRDLSDFRKWPDIPLRQRIAQQKRRWGRRC